MTTAAEVSSPPPSSSANRTPRQVSDSRLVPSEWVKIGVLSIPFLIGAIWWSAHQDARMLVVENAVQMGAAAAAASSERQAETSTEMLRELQKLNATTIRIDERSSNTAGRLDRLESEVREKD